MEPAKITFSMTVDGRIDTIFRADAAIDEGILSFADGSGNDYRIEYDDDTVRVLRAGTATMDFTFKTGTATTGVLRTAEATIRASATTRRLRVRSDRIDLEYDLVEDGRVLSRHRMSIEWK
ncbi:MAG: DUF1934 family protein [Candidatus Izemoplasmatales bacterium]